MRKTYLTTLLLLLVCWCGTAFAQQLTVSGTVTGAEDNFPLPGVSVIVKGTTTGVSTNADGSYQINVPNQKAVLLFRFLGYETKEVQVGNQAVLNVQLGADNQQLKEVVVTALGITREERSLGYSTQQVDGENLTLTKEQNVLGSLAGRVAGVQVSGSSGASMGGTQRIKIRGVNTLSGNDQPLIVIDGTPMANTNFAERSGQDYGNAIQDINPDDIESVNVLKGPAASALYGLRGQHGVIMITTKKGAQGKVRVEYSGAYSVEKAGNFMPLQNTYGGGSTQKFSTLENGDPYVNQGADESWGPRMDGQLVRQFYSFYPADPDYGKLTPFVPHPDNIKDFYEQGHTFNNNIAVSGGGANSTFRLSFNNTSIEGVTPNTWLDRSNLGFNGAMDVSKKIKVSTSLNYAYNQAQRPGQGYDNGATYLTQWFQRSVDMERLKNYKYDDGSFLHWNIDNPNGAGVVSDLEPLYWNNPYFEAYENYSQDKRDRFFGNVGLTYEVMDGLKLSGFARSDMFTQNIDTRSARGGRSLQDFSIGKYQNREMNYEFMGQYTKYWGELSLNANVGANLLQQEYSYLYQSAEGGLSTPNFFNIAASIDRPEVSSYLREKEVKSVYGMVSLGYKDTWFLDASLRNDNSSTLPEDNNSYWYPSISGSAVFSELVAWSPLSFGKVRVSYAQAGSDLEPYQTSFNYAIGNTYSDEERTINTLYIPDKLNNPLIKPSFSHSFETGLDLKFLQDRIGMNFTWYQQRNRNQILTLPVSGASGYASTVINAGLIENKGYEVALSAVPVAGKFTWDLGVNFSRNKSMIKELYSDGTMEINNYQIASNTYSRVTVSVNATEGQPYGTLIGQAYMRDPDTGKILLDAQSLPLYEPNHNFGSVLPDYTGGVTNNFSYGPLSLSALVDFQIGGQFFSWSRMLAVKTGQAVETAALNDRGKNVRDPLSEGGGVKVTGVYGPGTIIDGEDVSGKEVSTYVDAKSYFRTKLGTQVYEEWLYDASYVKLRELRLGYTLGSSLLSKLPFTSVNIGLVSRNPFMIWQKAPKGLNPSELANGSEPISWLETGQLVSVRSFGLSLNVTL